MTPIIIAIAAVVLFVFFIIYTNNRLIALNNSVTSAFSSIDVWLKNRHDLLPNLVELVKQYMSHEKTLLTQVTELRTKSTNGTLSQDDKVQLDNQLSKSFGSFMVAVENYPTLKANENVLQLQATWNETEEQIAAARRAYNAAVKEYNNVVQMFPSSIIASSKGFQLKAFFVASDEDRKEISAKALFAN